jgi:hypothetical protein
VLCIHYTYEILGAEGNENQITRSIEDAARSEFGDDLERVASWAITHRSCNILLKFKKRLGYASRLSKFRRAAEVAVKRCSNASITCGDPLPEQGISPVARNRQAASALEKCVPGIITSLSAESAAAATASLVAGAQTARPYRQFEGYLWQIYMKSTACDSHRHPVSNSKTVEELSDDLIRKIGANVSIGDVAVVAQTPANGSTDLLVFAQGTQPTKEKWVSIAKQMTDPPFYYDSKYWCSFVLGWSPKHDWSEYGQLWNSRVVRADIGVKVDWPTIQKSHVPCGINLEGFQHDSDAAERAKLSKFFAALAVEEKCGSMMVIEQAPSETSLVVHDPQQQYLAAVHSWSWQIQELKKQVDDLTKRNITLEEKVALFNNRDVFKVCQCHMDAEDPTGKSFEIDVSSTEGKTAVLIEPSNTELKTIMKRYKSENCQLQRKVQVLEQQTERLAVDLSQFSDENMTLSMQVCGLKSRLKHGEH